MESKNNCLINVIIFPSYLFWKQVLFFIFIFLIIYIMLQMLANELNPI